MSGAHWLNLRDGARRFAEHVPRHVGAQFLASNFAVGGAFDRWAIFGGHVATRAPVADGALNDADCLTELCRATHLLDCPVQRCSHARLNTNVIFHVNTNVRTMVGLITSVKPRHLDSLAKRVQYARKERGLSQEALAALANCSQGTIGNIESGSRVGKFIGEIAEALDVRLKWLRLGEEPMARPSAWPFPNVARERYERLDLQARGHVEAAMLRSLDALENPAARTGSNIVGSNDVTLGKFPEDIGGAIKQQSPAWTPTNHPARRAEDKAPPNPKRPKTGGK